MSPNTRSPGPITSTDTSIQGRTGCRTDRFRVCDVNPSIFREEATHIFDAELLENPKPTC